MFSLSPDSIVEISFKAADASNVGSKSCSANLFPYFIDVFTPLINVQETCHCTCVNTYDGVANEMVCDSGKLHNDDTHILNTFGKLTLNQLLHRHMPSHVIYRR